MSKPVVALTKQHPLSCCARVKVWFVGDAKGNKRTSVESWGPVSEAFANVLYAGMMRTGSLTPEMLEACARNLRETGKP